MLTDNGSAYRSKAFAAVCSELGIKHRFTRPYTPRTNGKAERFIQTALREWAYAATYASTALLCQWVGPGGDSLGIGHRAVWLTNYHAGTISRIDLSAALPRCHPALRP